MQNWIDVEVTNEEVLIHATARLMKDGNYYIDARVGGDVLLGGVKFTIDQVVEVKLIREDDQAVEHRVQSDGALRAPTTEELDALTELGKSKRFA